MCINTRMLSADPLAVETHDSLLRQVHPRDIRVMLGDKMALEILKPQAFYSP
jgi:hypothetical protein